MTVKPISPSEVAEIKKDLLPDFVIETWNNTIAKFWNGSYAMIFQNKIITELLEKSPILITRNEIFDEHWLDVEDIYIAEGWNVKYDKPAYNENYEPTFKFSKK